MDHHGNDRQPTPQWPLRLVFWELTARCNLHCRHCRAEAGPDASPDELATGEIISAARSIRDFADPIVVLTGGEPLVRSDFFEIAEACRGTFSRVALATNGTLIDDTMAQRIVNAGIARTSISLDGATAETHDAFRGQTGSFTAALTGFEALKQAGMSMQVNVTVTKHNVHELERLLTLAMEKGAEAFHVFMLVPVGCGAEIADDQRLSPQETERALTWLFEKSVELGQHLQIKATCAPQYFRIMQTESARRGVTVAKPRHGMAAVTRGCLAGSAVCFISRTGDVQPCGYLPLQVGNVRRQPLQTIWQTSPTFADLRNPDKLTGKCGACQYRKLCAGCRARAYATTGDHLAEEPDCPHQP